MIRARGGGSESDAGPPVSDAVLVGRAQKGDRSAEDALYRRHARTIIGLLGRILRRHEDLDDIVQDTFVVAFEGLRRLREPERFRAWLISIAVKRARKLIRRNRLRRALGLDRGADEGTLESMAAPDLGPEARMELLLVDSVLERLPLDERIAWTLRFVEGETLQDVALACGCSLATVKRRIRAAQIEIASTMKLGDDGDE